MDAAEVESTIRVWLARSPGRNDVQAAFFGGSFTCLPLAEQIELLGAVQPFIERGEVGGIRLSTRPDCISDEICRVLRDNRVEIVELGVQSCDDRVLALARRGHTAEDFRRAAAMLRHAGIGIGVQLMPGLPGETTCSFIKGVYEIVHLKPDLVRLYPAVILKHSALAVEYLAGRYRPLSLNRAVALTARAKDLFDAAGIPVIRMGLQPSEELEKEVLAGPYHPAFGELVLSRLWFRRLRAQLAGLAAGEHLAVRISGRDRSAIVGKNRMNIRRLEALGFAGRFTFYEEQRERGSVEYVVG
jgi:histone acetyltransferase (RNA polymerase elongator complex component)